MSLIQRHSSLRPILCSERYNAFDARLCVIDTRQYALFDVARITRKSSARGSA